VATVIMGQDGLSYAPLGPVNLSSFRRYLAGLNGDASADITWSSVAEYRAAFDRTVTMNTAYALPHAPLRLETLGFRNVPLGGPQLEAARRLMERSFEEGAIAFSTGLSYFPNTYADTEELVALCEVAAAAGRPYVTHIRSVFDPPAQDWLVAGLEEALEIGRRSGAAVHVSHFGPKPWRYARPDELLKDVDRARGAGVRVTLEVYPYPSGNSYFLIYLPPWAHDGGHAAILDLLRSGSERDRLVEAVETNSISPFGAQIGRIGGRSDDPLLGRTIDGIAEEWGVRVGEAILRLLDREELDVGAREPLPRIDGLWDLYRRDLMSVLRRGDYMIGSDGIPAAAFPHPRTFGTFPRLLRFARETGALTLEAVIHLMTELPARTFGLDDRGTLRVGAHADLVIFDPVRFTVHATYEQPTLMATGVEHLLVNGAFVIDEGRITDARPGRAVP
jgi:N-acyl-D-amino-acid deacylase